MKAGDPRVLYDLGIELLDIAPLRISTQSKADRGYGLAFQMEPNTVKATAPAICAAHNSRKSTLCEVTVFLFAVERQLRKWPEKSQRETRWFALKEASRLVAPAGLAELL